MPGAQVRKLPRIPATIAVTPAPVKSVSRRRHDSTGKATKPRPRGAAGRLQIEIAKDAVETNYQNECPPGRGHTRYLWNDVLIHTATESCWPIASPCRCQTHAPPCKILAGRRCLTLLPCSPTLAAGRLGAGPCSCSPPACYAARPLPQHDRAPPWRAAHAKLDNVVMGAVPQHAAAARPPRRRQGMTDVPCVIWAIFCEPPTSHTTPILAQHKHQHGNADQAVRAEKR